MEEINSQQKNRRKWWILGRKCKVLNTCTDFLENIIFVFKRKTHFHILHSFYGLNLHKIENFPGNLNCEIEILVRQ